MNETLTLPLAEPRERLERTKRRTSTSPRGQREGKQYISAPTVAQSPYKVFVSLEEAEAAATRDRAAGFAEVRIENGFAQHPSLGCLWLYGRADSREDGRTITVTAHDKTMGLVYLRENGEFR